MAFSVFTVLCSYHLCLAKTFFITPKGNLALIKQLLGIPFFPPKPLVTTNLNVFSLDVPIGQLAGDDAIQ